MKLFVNTRGFSRQDPKHEFRWRPAPGCLGDAQELLGKPRFEGFSLGQLFEGDSRNASIVLTRSLRQIHLLVTRLRSNRVGSQGEPLFNAVLLEGSEGELNFLRALAADVLQTISVTSDEPDQRPESALELCINEAVAADDDEGFVVDPQEGILKSLRLRIARRIPVQPVSPVATKWIPLHGNNNRKLRLELRQQLQDAAFPRGDGPLAVVTGVMELPVVASTGCWRALTQVSQSQGWVRTPLEWGLQFEHERQELDRCKLGPTWLGVAASVCRDRWAE
jgi:hypothetical protein